MRKYYIECKINGIKEKFEFKNKQALNKYLGSPRADVLRCGNVSNLECYSEEV